MCPLLRPEGHRSGRLWGLNQPQGQGQLRRIVIAKIPGVSSSVASVFLAESTAKIAIAMDAATT